MSAPNPECPGCRTLQQRVVELETRLAGVEARPTQNSANSNPGDRSGSGDQKGLALPRVGAILFVVVAVLYTVGVVFGFVSQGHRIDAVNLALIALAILGAILLVRPNVLGQLQAFEVWHIFKVEMRQRVEGVERGMLGLNERCEALIMTAMSGSRFKHLYSIGCFETYDDYDVHDKNARAATKRELDSLKDDGFIDLEQKYKDKCGFLEDGCPQNLVEFARPTEAGWAIIDLRKDEVPEKDKAKVVEALRRHPKPNGPRT